MKVNSTKKELLLQKKYNSMRNIVFYIIVLFSLISCKSDEVLFTLTTEVSPTDSGSISPKSGSVWLGDQINLNAIPNTGFSFLHWTSGDSSSEIIYDSINSTSISIIINSDLTITANFLPKTQLNDSSFEKYLIEIGIDDILDGFVDTKKCLSVTSMDLSNKNIRDLTGLNVFKNLKVLVADNNFLENIDLSQNDKLEILSLSNNNLENIDLSSLPSLALLNLSSNNFNSLDVSSSSYLYNLDIRKNPNLNCIKVSSTQIVDDWLNKVNNVSLQEINRYQFRKGRPSEPGFPVQQAGTEGSSNRQNKIQFPNPIKTPKAQQPNGSSYWLGPRKTSVQGGNQALPKASPQPTPKGGYRSGPRPILGPKKVRVQVGTSP